MAKKIRTTDTNLTITNSEARIVTVGDFKFVKEDDCPWINVYLTGGEIDEFLEEIDNNEISLIETFKDFEVFALNWVFNNVEIISEFTAESEVACTK